jgi:diaminopimelate epimerase
LHISVDMGCVSDLTEPHNWAALGCNPDRPVRHVSMGNPHSVVGVDDVAAVELAELGQKVPHVNLEIIEPGPEPHAITMRVHERGAGITMACGTGACAAAEAAVAWGLVPASTPEVIVHMDGGDAKVRVDSSTRAVTLIGPAVFVASISVHM